MEPTAEQRSRFAPHQFGVVLYGKISPFFTSLLYDVVPNLTEMSPTEAECHEADTNEECKRTQISFYEGQVRMCKWFNGHGGYKPWCDFDPAGRLSPAPLVFVFIRDTVPGPDCLRFVNQELLHNPTSAFAVKDYVILDPNGYLPLKSDNFEGRICYLLRDLFQNYPCNYADRFSLMRLCFPEWTPGQRDGSRISKEKLHEYNKRMSAATGLLYNLKKPLGLPSMNKKYQTTRRYGLMIENLATAIALCDQVDKWPERVRGTILFGMQCVMVEIKMMPFTVQLYMCVTTTDEMQDLAHALFTRKGETWRHMRTKVDARCARWITECEIAGPVDQVLFMTFATDETNDSAAKAKTGRHYIYSSAQLARETGISEAAMARTPFAGYEVHAKQLDEKIRQRNEEYQANLLQQLQASAEAEAEAEAELQTMANGKEEEEKEEEKTEQPAESVACTVDVPEIVSSLSARNRPLAPVSLLPPKKRARAAEASAAFDEEEYDNFSDSCSSSSSEDNCTYAPTHSPPEATPTDVMGWSAWGQRPRRQAATMALKRLKNCL